MGNNLSGQEELKEKRTKAPWYYYILGLFLYSITTTLLTVVARVNGGGLLQIALVSFFIIFFPKWLWEAKKKNE